MQYNVLVEQKLSFLGALLFISFIGVSIMLLWSRSKMKKAEQKSKEKLRKALEKIELQKRIQTQYLDITQEVYTALENQLVVIVSAVDRLALELIKEEKLQSHLCDINVCTKQMMYGLRHTVWTMGNSCITIEKIKTHFEFFLEDLWSDFPKKKIEIQIMDAGLSQYHFTSNEGFNLCRTLQEVVLNALENAQVSYLDIVISQDNENIFFQMMSNKKEQGTQAIFDIKKELELHRKVWQLGWTVDNMHTGSVLDYRIKVPKMLLRS